MSEALGKVKECFRAESSSNDRETKQKSIIALGELTTASPSKLFEVLKMCYKISAVGGGHSDESVFAGLDYALTKLEKDQGHSCKMAIVIGDRGDKMGKVH